MSAWVRLINHQTRGSYTYWPHNTPRLDQRGWKTKRCTFCSALDSMWCTMNSNRPYRCWHHSQSTNVFMDEVDTPLYKQPSKGITKHGQNIGTFLASVLDSVWCNMSSNHPYRSWNPYQFIIMFMGEVDTPLHKQQSKGITYILATQYSKDIIPWVDGWKLAHFLLKPSWIVCDVLWDPTIHTCVDTPLNSSMYAWMRLIHHCTGNQSRGSHPYWPHNIQRMYHVWMNENWGTFILCLGWCVMYHELQPHL